MWKWSPRSYYIKKPSLSFPTLSYITRPPPILFALGGTKPFHPFVILDILVFDFTISGGEKAIQTHLFFIFLISQQWKSKYREEEEKEKLNSNSFSSAIALGFVFNENLPKRVSFTSQIFSYQSQSVTGSNFVSIIIHNIPNINSKHRQG